MKNETEIEKCLIFIDKYIIPHSRYYKGSSYGLKHAVENFYRHLDSPTYVSNDSFKDAMIKAGYQPKNVNDINHTYKIKVMNKYLNFPPNEKSKWI